MTALATTVAFACGLAAGVPQIARMVRRRDSQAQSPYGWAIGAKGAAATAYVGAVNGAAPTVYGPSLAGATVAVIGLAVTVYFRPPPAAGSTSARLTTPSTERISMSRFITAIVKALRQERTADSVHFHAHTGRPYPCYDPRCTSPRFDAG